MTDRAALLAAILAHPDEDTPRLAYADLLDEGGDAGDRVRAGFIRVQCRAARAAPFTAERHDLEDRAAELEFKHGKTWAAGAEGLAVGFLFARGFVERVTVFSKRFVSEGEKLFAVHPVRGVKFVDMSSGRGAAPSDQIFACPLLARLHTLELVGRVVNDAFAAQLCRSPHVAGLRCLHLNGHTLSPKGLRAVLESDRLSALSELNVSNSPGTQSAHLAAIAKSPYLARLKRLDFYGCAIGEDGACALAGSKHAAGLESLRLRHEPVPGNPPLRGPGAVALAESPHLRGLTELVIHAQELRKKGAEAFARAFAWPALKRLSLRRNEIPPAALAAFAGNPAFGSLLEFDLTSNPITARDLEPLRAAFPNTSFITDDTRRPLFNPDAED